MKMMENYGVIEVEKIIELLNDIFKKDSPFEIQVNILYGHMCCFGDYYIHECFDKRVISAYNEEMTKKILEARESQTNKNITYPIYTRQQLEDDKDQNTALVAWRDYVNFNVFVSAEIAQWFHHQIPLMAKSGVISKDEIVDSYVEQVHRWGGRKSKKAAVMIQQLCEESPLATLKGNTNNTFITQDIGQTPNIFIEKKVKSKEYEQLSFEDMI